MVLLLWQVANIVLIIVYVSVLMLFGYTFLLADSEGAGLNGRISRLLYSQIPQTMSQLSSDILGQKAHTKLLETYQYVFIKKNPIMQLV